MRGSKSNSSENLSEGFLCDTLLTVNVINLRFGLAVMHLSFS